MCASSVQSLLLAGALAMTARATVTFAEESVSTAPPLPATLEPKVPVTPGRLHGGAYDPHARLDPETQIRIALRHKAKGRPREALGVLSKAIAGHRDDARLYAVRGSLLLEAGHVAPALADLEQAVRLDPDDVETLTNRAQAYPAGSAASIGRWRISTAPWRSTPSSWRPASTAAPCVTAPAIIKVLWRISTAASPSLPIYPDPTSTGRRSRTPWGTRKPPLPTWIDSSGSPGTRSGTNRPGNCGGYSKIRKAHRPRLSRTRIARGKAR